MEVMEEEEEEEEEDDDDDDDDDGGANRGIGDLSAVPRWLRAEYSGGSVEYCPSHSALPSHVITGNLAGENYLQVHEDTWRDVERYTLNAVCARSAGN